MGPFVLVVVLVLEFFSPFDDIILHFFEDDDEHEYEEDKNQPSLQHSNTPNFFTLE